MKASTDRILSTHTGSLPRPPDLLEMIRAREQGEHGEPVDARAFATRVQSAVEEVVRKQVEAGIDVVSDGEMGKPSFATYVTHRLVGFGGENPEPRVFADRAAFPEWASEYPGSSMKRQFCVEPLFALADVMKEEYRAIARAGLVLQIDAPDAAMGRHVEFRDSSLDDFRKAVALRVEALNHALDGIPQEQVRYHICWGNYEGPHTHDVPLKDIVDLVLRVRAGAYSVEASNPRHAHEWRIWEEVKLPPGKSLIPGVIDSTTNFVEHPEVVAQRIEQYARLVGRENIMAGTDCGFGTSAGRTRVHPQIVWAKLEALAEGARLASRRLWG